MRGANKSNVQAIHEVHPVLQDPDPLLCQVQPGCHDSDGPVGELKLAHPPVDILPGRRQVLGMLPGLPAPGGMGGSNGRLRKRILVIHGAKNSPGWITLPILAITLERRKPENRCKLICIIGCDVFLDFCFPNGIVTNREVT